MIELNKKNIIISSIIFFILIFITFYFINLSNIINPLEKNNIQNTNIYYIEEGLEEISKAIEPAVLNYLNQDRSESAFNREKRLRLFFTSDSPIYETKPQNINSKINKSISTITSIKNDSSESVNYIITVKTTFYSGSKTSTGVQKYWLSMTKINNGIQFPYYIGEYKQ